MLWPSTRATFQPDALKRFTWSVASDMPVEPSMVTALSSNSTIRFLRLQVTCERDGFLADALHQAAIAGDHIGACG